MQVFQQAFLRYGGAANAWLDRLSAVNLESFERLINNIPLQSISTPAQEFALRLLDLNRNALVSRTFDYA